MMSDRESLKENDMKKVQKEEFLRLVKYFSRHFVYPPDDFLNHQDRRRRLYDDSEKYINSIIEKQNEINVKEEFQKYISHLLETKFDEVFITVGRVNNAFNRKLLEGSSMGDAGFIDDFIYYGVFDEMKIEYDVVKFLIPAPIQQLTEKMINYFEHPSKDGKITDYLEMTEDERDSIFGEMYDGRIILPFDCKVVVNGDETKLSILYDDYCRVKEQVIEDECAAATRKL